jgi:hypothetical protein
MSTTPAATLARLKLTYANWQIERKGLMWRATYGDAVIGWTSLGDLEQQLSRQTWKGQS